MALNRSRPLSVALTHSDAGAVSAAMAGGVTAAAPRATAAATPIAAVVRFFNMIAKIILRFVFFGALDCLVRGRVVENRTSGVSHPVRREETAEASVVEASAL